MSGIAIAIVVGLLFAVLVNILADVLPQYRMQEQEDEPDVIASDKAEVGVQVADTIKPAGPWSWSPVRLLTIRALVVTLLIFAASVYLAQRESLVGLVLVHLFYVALFTLIAVIDIEHRLVLTVLMIPAFVIALIEIAVSGRITIGDAMIGYAVAQIVQLSFYLFGAIYLSIINARSNEPIREVAFGFGDVTLATFCGMVVGFPDVIYMLVLMILIGGTMGFVYLVIRLIITRKYQAHMVIPYGPAIVAAAALLLLWGDAIVPYLMGQR
jgi:prepilin signal peptidase PulO-like enzyme (type II secretory pathway)